jgi:transposase
MAIPGVGSVTALSFKAAVDDPTRFAKSKTVGAHFGLTSRRIQSGDTIDIDGHISKCGDGDGEVRTALYEAASAMLVRSKKWCVKAWGVRIAAKSGHKRAVVVAARKLSVIMHRRSIDGNAFLLGAGRVLSLAEKRSEEDVGGRVVSAPPESIKRARATT